MLGDLHRCIGCMHEIGNYDICPYCGYHKDSVSFPEHLPLKTVLKNRYIVGAAINDDCQGITYIGFDKTINHIIEIKEYSPSKICKRIENSLNISVNIGFEAQYKAYMSDFIELYTELSKLRTLQHIVHIYDVFEENNTAYAICEHIVGINLKQFILENAGEISLDITKPLIIPIINTLSILHSANIIHRGISPETLILTNKNQLKLTSFSISVTRVADSELDSELFLGYAAPEQYSSNSYHGPWTDVYSIAAVIYKMLTGTMPTEANLRAVNDNLLSPDKLNPNIPKYFAKIIVEALKISPSERIKNMPDFLNAINKSIQQYEKINISSNSNNQSINNKNNVSNNESLKSRKYVFLSMGITIISLLIVLIVIFIFVFGLPSLGNNKDNIINHSTPSSEHSSLISSSNSSTPSSNNISSSPKNSITVPDLIGQNINSVKNNPVYKNLLEFEVVSEFHNTYKPNIIFEQSISPNKEVESGTKITLKVSKGTRYPVIPDYYGIPVKEYTNTLDKLGIPYTIKNEYIPELPNGYVFKTSIEVGQTIDLQANVKLIVYVTSN